MAPSGSETLIVTTPKGTGLKNPAPNSWKYSGLMLNAPVVQLSEN